MPALTTEPVYDVYAEFVSAQMHTWDTIPHCDSRILHAPAECEHCNRPEWTAKRLELGIAFTGHEPASDQVPCPADASRPAESAHDHRRWAGNKPTTAQGDPTWPFETNASQMMYGDFGGRAEWPLLERIQRRTKVGRWLLRHRP